MNILQALLAAQGGGAVQQLGRQFGLKDDQASAALSGGRHGQYLDDLGALARPETVADGNGILGHILGSKDVSRQVAAQAAASTGLGPDILKQMLPVVAAMMMGALAKNAAGGRATAGVGAAPAGMGGGLLDMLTPMLDTNRDGSVVDDVTGMLGKFLGGR